MRAVTIPQAGSFDVLQIASRDVRVATPHEVRITVKAAAVSPTDLLTRELGAKIMSAVPHPWTPGMDAAGIIESVGGNVDRLHVGDQVMAAVTPRRPEGGAQADLLVLPAASVVPIPAGASLAQASTLPMNGLTARYGLELIGASVTPARLSTLAVSGGAGWLAYLVIVLAKLRGLRVIADAKPADFDLVRGYGADVVLPRGDGFAAAVRAEVPAGVDAFFDTALLLHKSFPAIRDGGVYVPVRGWDKSPSERGIVIKPVLVSEVLERTDWLDELRELAEKGTLKLKVHAEYPVEKVADAQKAMAAGGVRGRIVLTFS
jgi:NADPH:quinone reductase-like Zn-dependent oxidoreductase